MTDIRPIPPSDRDELELERRYLRRSRVDATQFEYFFHKYYDNLFKYIVMEVRDADAAQDLTNEVFTVALDGLDRFQWRGIRVGAWLFQIARNLMKVEARKLARHREEPLGDGLDMPSGSEGVDAEMHRAEEQNILLCCLDRLEPIRREIFLAHYWSNLKVREISIITKMSEANVKAHLRRGRRKLLKCVLEQGVERHLSDEKKRLVNKLISEDDGEYLLGDGE